MTTNNPTEDISILTQALSLIAAPMRPDGTWNRDRRACQILAEEALRKVGYYGSQKKQIENTPQTLLARFL
jgi:hypothetical protein